MNLPQGIGRPAHRALAAAGITRLEQFTSISEEELLKLHGIGPKAIRIIKESLRENGLPSNSKRPQPVNPAAPGAYDQD